MSDQKNLIVCLECGRWFRSLGSHINRTHQMNARDYKIRFDLSMSTPLACDDLRRAQAALLARLVDDQVLTRDHLAGAMQKARSAGRGVRSSSDRRRQAEIAQSLPRDVLPPGATRADGRDADRARAYQRAYRAAKKPRPETQ